MNQPDPVANDNPVIHELLIEMIQQRLDLGIKKYGVPIKPFNGRRSLQDVLDELLDASVYVLQEIEERKALEKRIGHLVARVQELEAK